jgi:hypothetical protein
MDANTVFSAPHRRLHDFARDTLLPHGHTIHEVLYNSCEATEFDVDEQSQIGLAELAAQMGVELFVMGDGWFHGRDNDMASLGDWWPDEPKFPNGLPPPANLPPLYPRGLDPDSGYEVEGIAGARSGDAWMRGGLHLDLGDFESTVRRIRRV